MPQNVPTLNRRPDFLFQILLEIKLAERFAAPPPQNPEGASHGGVRD